MPSDAIHSSYAAIIPATTALSKAVELGGRRLFGIVFPDTMDSTQVGFKVKVDGDTEYRAMFDEAGDEILMDVQTGKLVVIDPVKFLGVRRFKIHCGTNGSDSDESAQRSLLMLTVE